MKAIRLFFIVAALILCCSLYAQNATQAKRILDKTAAIVGRRGGAAADFTISGGSYGRTGGSIAIKGSKFMASTPQVKVWYDGRTQWSYTKSTDEVNVSRPTEAQRAAMNPYSFITMYRSGYNLSMKTINGTYRIHLQATNKSRSVQQMYITIGKNYLPMTVKLLQGKHWTTINIRNFHAKNQSDALFVFPVKAYPNAEIIDLR